MVSQKKGNPVELLILADRVQRGFGETGKNPVLISRFIARQRTVINLSQNHKNRMPVFFVVVCARLREHTTTKIQAFFLFFWRSK
jgi:hypothetical protein